MHQDECCDAARAAPDSPPRVYACGDGVVVELHGEIDLVGHQRAAPVLDPVTSGDARTVVIDLTHVTFIDCSCLTLLMRAWRRVTSRGARLRVVCADRMALHLMSITGLRVTLAPVATVDEALGRPAPRARRGA
ncbi:STAS domain-containing protein [Streptomyces longispororuber]|uniref:STAS domain-containing protein n=1 Tax=Streptomyces longispororuber TaxID=68230 RepID=UPI0033FA0C65